MIRVVSPALLLFTALSLPAEESTQVLRISAAEFYARGSAYHTQLSADGKSIELTPGVLFEHDGIAAGYSYQPNEEILDDQFWATKHFQIDSIGEDGNERDQTGHRQTRTWLLLGHTGPTPRVKVNGNDVTLGEPQKAGNYWKAFEIQTFIKEGKNVVQLSGSGKLWIARYDDITPAPHTPLSLSCHSFKEVAGKEQPLLGPKNDIAGEYYIRLYRDNYLHHGRTKSLLFDAADLFGGSIPPPFVVVKGIQVEIDSKATGHGTGICVHSMSPQVPEPWGRSLVNSRICTIVPEEMRPAPRYFGVEVDWQGRESGRTPRLYELKITTKVETDGDWGSEKLKILDKYNPEFICQSGGSSRTRDKFPHEDLKHPRLAELRQQYALDEVVKGCTTDLQRMEKLAVWTSQQWTKGHLGKIYPKWDALEILKKHEDGTPIGGFCQQFNIVFLQACESFGMVGRCVSIGSGDHGVKIRSGHEVVEIWSNELNKWVYVDGQAAWYFVDKETRTPLNLLELRERQLAAILNKSASQDSKREVDVVVLAPSPYEWKGLTDWPAFAELRMIPHTQFLDGKKQLPVNQGMRGWFWTGHRVWTDELYPASLLYADRVTHVTDWNCPINQTRYWLQQSSTPGEIIVRLQHNMPSFHKFVVQLDRQLGHTIDKDSFIWRVRRGENDLRVHAVNVQGIRGPASWMKVEYNP